MLWLKRDVISAPVEDVSLASLQRIPRPMHHDKAF